MEWITCIVLETLGGDCMNRRKAIESLYKGLCDIYEYETSKDPVTGRTKKSEEYKMNASPILAEYLTTAHRRLHRLRVVYWFRI